MKVELEDIISELIEVECYVSDPSGELERLIMKYCDILEKQDDN